MKSYVKGIFDKFGYLATWLPNAPLSLGDVGTLTDGSFQRVTSLENLGIEFGVRRGPSALDLSHSSEEGVTLTTSTDADASTAGAQALVSVAFSTKGAFVFQAKSCVETTIEDQAKLARDILARFKSGEEWNEEWVVINTVVEAKCATILVSSSATANVDISAGGALPVGGVALADASLALRVLSQKGDVTNVIAQRSLKPLFRASRIKGGLIEAIRRRVFGGAARVETVSSIGPQMFSADAGDSPEPGESAVPEEERDAFEDVRPE